MWLEIAALFGKSWRSFRSRQTVMRQGYTKRFYSPPLRWFLCNNSERDVMSNTTLSSGTSSHPWLKFSQSSAQKQSQTSQSWQKYVMDKDNTNENKEKPCDPSMCCKRVFGCEKPQGICGTIYSEAVRISQRLRCHSSCAWKLCRTIPS